MRPLGHFDMEKVLAIAHVAVSFVSMQRRLVYNCIRFNAATKLLYCVTTHSSSNSPKIVVLFFGLFAVADINFAGPVAHWLVLLLRKSKSTRTNQNMVFLFLHLFYRPNWTVSLVPKRGTSLLNCVHICRQWVMIHLLFSYLWLGKCRLLMFSIDLVQSTTELKTTLTLS